jgi:hypothetical protein
VECVDCHNPHQANRTGVPLSNPPAADGPLRGVTGINRDTLAPGVAQYEYEVCFKCHSGPNAGSFFGISNTPVKRIITEPDENKRFNRYQTTSFHPVTYQRLGTGASLWSSLQTSMLMIYCCDCHNSDQSSKAGGTGPNGPHGSQYEHIMIQRYDEPPLPPDVWSPVNDFVTRYGVCFRCHSDNFVMSTSSGFVNNGVSEHGTHVQDRGIPCFACHDPHGVPSNGITFTNSSHLVNFAQAWSVSVAVPVPSYNPDTRTCVVSCHTSSNHSHTYTR